MFHAFSLVLAVDVLLSSMLGSCI